MTLILSQLQVRELLPMQACMDLMEEALAALSRGDAINPLRRGMRLTNDLGILGMMPGYLGSPRTLGLKVVTVFPGNHGTAYDSHQGVVMIFDLEHGAPLCIMDASEVTAIRTAAVSGVATRLLANADASDLAIIGSGVQARTHLQAMSFARSLARVRIYSSTPTHRHEFAARESSRYPFDVIAVDSVQEAVDGADIVCTTTSSKEPILRGEWITSGAHINAVGSSVPYARELDTAAVVKARLFVDRTESTVNEAGDFITPCKEGAITESHIRGELGDLLLGKATGRNHPNEITLFKSLGLAVEDLAAANHVYSRASELGVGVDVPLGGVR